MAVDTPIKGLAELAEQRLYISELNWMPQQNGTMKLAVGEYSEHEISEMIKSFARHNILAVRDSIEGTGNRTLIVGQKSANIIREMFLEAELSTLDALWQNGPDDRGLKSLLERQEAELRSIRVVNDAANVGTYSAEELLEMFEQNEKSVTDANKHTYLKGAVGKSIGLLGLGLAAHTTYKEVEQELVQDRPQAAANVVARNVAALTTGTYGFFAASEAALPLLAFGPPGEVAYGATVLGAAYASGELTVQLSRGFEYLDAKTKEFLEAQKQVREIDAHLRDIAEKNGINPENSGNFARSVISEKLRQDSNAEKNIFENDMPSILKDFEPASDHLP
ncbi:MAG: hypothetical protein WBL28_07990 [Methylotenera sp.]